MTEHMELGSETLYADAREERRKRSRLLAGLGVDDARLDDLLTEAPSEELPFVPPTMDRQVLEAAGLDSEPTDLEGDSWILPDDDSWPEKQDVFEVMGRIESDKDPTELPPRQIPQLSLPWRDVFTTLIELIGMLVLSYGFWLITAWAGFVCLGICLILMGVMLSLPPRSKDTGQP